MNTLSTWTFYQRHRRRAALLLGLTCLVTAGLYTLPTPIAAVAVTTGTATRTLFRLDPVSIIERRR